MIDDSVRVFVSYAHADRPVQEAFEAQLRAAETQGAFTYWADTRLQPGDNWDQEIKAHIAMADIALLLVSDSFLSSAYCTATEVPRLLGDKRKIFWVTVNECPWELSPFQSVQACASLGGMDHVQIKSAAKQVVLQIAAHAKEVRRLRSPAKSFLAQCMPERVHLFTQFEELHRGRHCWVQRAQAVYDHEAKPVVIKALLRNPFDNVESVFGEAATRASTLRHPSFIRLLDHCLTGRFPVLVMEGIRLPSLNEVLRKQGPFRPDDVRDMVAQAAEAFAELERAEGIYGVLTSQNVFVDLDTRTLRFSALSVTGLLSQIVNWKEFVGIDPEAAAYLIPEQFSNQPVTPYSDQYVLGQLAIEMLTGCQTPPAEVVTPFDLAARAAFFDRPLEAITAPWIHYHTGLANTLTRLLNPDPQHRFATLDEALRELWSVDDEVVAYARFAYKIACDQPRFFNAFYSAFFAVCPGAQAEFTRAHGAEHADRMIVQAVALKYALAATLGRPEALTSNLAHLTVKHRTIPPEYFAAFTDTFINTLQREFPDLPQFVLSACRTVLDRAGKHLGSGVPERAI
jgi:hypothetical protein